jgi:uncharacterized membrane protein
MFVICISPLIALGQQELRGRFTTIDFPDSTYTDARGINAEGGVVGRYDAPSGTVHGFLLNEAGFTTIDYPGAISTRANGINAQGSVVGFYCPTAPCGPINTYHGFVLSDGKFTSFTFPGHTNVFVTHINETGDITGCYHDGDLMASMHGFLLSDGKFTGFDVPVSMHNQKSLDGTIVGLFLDPSLLKYRAYTLKDATFSPFDFPGATLTWAWDINEKGETVGEYADALGNRHGFLRNKKGFFSVDYPGAVETRALAINPEGNVVGRYTDTSNHVHGFLLTRHPSK